MRHLLTRLTHATAASATAVDSALVGPLLAQPSAAAYRTFLCTLYGFVAPLETSLVMTYGLDFAFLAPRIRSGYIATDLLSLGLTTGDFHRLAHRHDVPPFTCTADALGWLFVSERITPHLGRLYPPPDCHPPRRPRHRLDLPLTAAESADLLRWRQLADALELFAATNTGADSHPRRRPQRIHLATGLARLSRIRCFVARSARSRGPALTHRVPAVTNSPCHAGVTQW